MPRKQAEYSEVRSKMQPGDIIAFSGKGNFSELIKWSTRSTVSHVGIVLQSKLLIGDSPQPGFFNQVIESTSLNGFSGVAISRLSDRVATYDGELWWLPLGKEARARLKFKEFYDFLLHQERKPYDLPQAVRSALDALDSIPLLNKATLNVEDFSGFFCSELAAAGLEAGGVISSINASEVTPIDLCMFDVYGKNYYQIKGKRKLIKGHNTLSPEGWGQ
jgi:hypothetical protein